MSFSHRLCQHINTTNKIFAPNDKLFAFSLSPITQCLDHCFSINLIQCLKVTHTTNKLIPNETRQDDTSTTTATMTSSTAQSPPLYSFLLPSLTLLLPSLPPLTLLFLSLLLPSSLPLLLPSSLPTILPPLTFSYWFCNSLYYPKKDWRIIIGISKVMDIVNQCSYIFKTFTIFNISLP